MNSVDKSARQLLKLYLLLQSEDLASCGPAEVEEGWVASKIRWGGPRWMRVMARGRWMQVKQQQRSSSRRLEESDR